MSPRELAGITSVGAGGSAPQSGPYGAPASVSEGGMNIPREVRERGMRWALKNPELRAELESLVYEDNRHVGWLDHDLASKRSFSLAAKVTFQRQRNVQRRIEQDVLESSPWRRISAWSDRALKLFNPLGV